ncbi:MAG: BlaI/MecI/CopY family transcriptional regulator [Oscillospiraceae bacterium]|jgi:BlaI family penicillinase repressor|nr:BlaI/MecI/CopY family transcriptional regulator [Oscillospiraceae bacterium]MDE6956099.1 BlaI/MecI/CopY family transcriptional regulator [Oscillospiraceae bacterium]
MDEKRGILSPSEWRVMECLWAGPKTLMELVRTLKDSAGWAKSTVTTMVRRMEEKGLVGYEEAGRAKVFRALLAREDAAAAEADSLLERAFHGSVGLLVSSLVERSSLSPSDIDELYNILERAEDGGFR